MANSAKHADPEYHRIRSLIVPAAYANPAHRCRLCGLTLAERRVTHPDERWTCGHPDRPGDIGYAAEHASCNYSQGAIDGNRRRNGFDVGL